MHNFDNYSHEYKNRRIFELWIKSCYFIEYFIQGNSKYPRIKEIHKFLKR